MLLILRRFIKTAKDPKEPDTVSAAIIMSADGSISEVGTLNFPSKTTWGKFYGALQKGALTTTDLEVKMENIENELAGKSS